jgi:hypothetical protein
MAWVNWLLIPPTAIVILLWGASLAARNFFRAWVLSYVGQGLGVIAAVSFLAGGDWQDAIAAACMAGGLLFTRQLFTADGLRKRFLPGGE